MLFPCLKKNVKKLTQHLLSPHLTSDAVISLDGDVDITNLRVVCQYLYVCLGDGFRKLASSHLLVPLASTDDDI